jgi:hypothetical protein
MDTAGGTTQLTDQSGNGHDGTMDGIVAGDWIADTRYDGTQLLDVDSADIISTTGAPCDESFVSTAFTISFFSEFEDAVNEASWRFGSSNTSGVRCRFYGSNNGFIYFDGGSVSTNWNIQTALMDRWVGSLLHFCLRYDGTETGNDRLKLCINGVNWPINGTPTIPASITFSDANVEFGRTATITDARGKFDDFRVFDRAITDAEAITLARFRGTATTGGGGGSAIALIGGGGLVY